jgi:hypothetical protein
MLLRMNANQWCDFAHDWDCSFAGIYQVRRGAIKKPCVRVDDILCWWDGRLRGGTFLFSHVVSLAYDF